MNNGSTDSESSALTTGLNKNDSLNQLTTHVKSSTLYGRTVVHPNFLAWWVTTILYNYGATLCELRYNAVGVLIGQQPIRNKNWPYFQIPLPRAQNPLP